MPPTLREFKDKFAEQAAPPLAVTPRIPDAVEVRFTKLTGSEEWDSFLRRCQALLDQAEESCDTWGKRALVATDDKDIREAQYCYHACNARVSTLKEVMAIPQSVLESKEHTS